MIESQERIGVLLVVIGTAALLASVFGLPEGLGRGLGSMIGALVTMFGFGLALASRRGGPR